MRIAHFSDPHLFALEGLSPWRLLNKRLTGWMNLKLHRGRKHREAYLHAVLGELRRLAVAQVVVTGDLTALALEQEFIAVRKLLHDEVGLEPRDVSVVPGNHDAYTRGALRDRRFGRFFEEFTTSDLPDIAVDLGLGRFPFVRIRDKVAIIGLSTAVPRPPLIAAGALGRSQAEALRAILVHPDVAQRVAVILLHHPPFLLKNRAKNFFEGIRDRSSFTYAVDGLASGLVLHGHLHRRAQRLFRTGAGQLRVVGATSASLHHLDGARMAGFNVYEFGPDGDLVNVEARVYEPETKGFRTETIPRDV